MTARHLDNLEIQVRKDLIQGWKTGSLVQDICGILWVLLVLGLRFQIVRCLAGLHGCEEGWIGLIGNNSCFVVVWWDTCLANVPERYSTGSGFQHIIWLSRCQRVS